MPPGKWRSPKSSSYHNPQPGCLNFSLGRVSGMRTGFGPRLNLGVRPTPGPRSRAHHWQSPHSTETGPLDPLCTHTANPIFHKIANPIFHKIARETFLKHIPDHVTPSLKLLRGPQGPQPVIQGISLSFKASMTCCNTIRNMFCLCPGFLTQSN